MSLVERPGVSQILSPERWVRPEELGLARPQSPGLHQQPDQNPGPDDARVATANRRIGLDTRVAVSEVAQKLVIQDRPRPNDIPPEPRRNRGHQVEHGACLNLPVLGTIIPMRIELAPSDRRAGSLSTAPKPAG